MKITSSLALLFTIALAGCVTPSTPPAAASAEPDPFGVLHKTMEAAQVKALVGEPAEIKPFNAEGFACEIWVYRRKVSENVRRVPMGTREVPGFNALTGEASNIKEPIYQNQYVTVTETVELLMYEQRVLELKRQRSAERDIR